MKYQLNLQRFTEEGTAPAAEPAAVSAETAPAAETAAEPMINAGDTLPNGQAASAQVAAAMNRQMKRHPELRKVYGQSQPQKPAQGNVPANKGSEAHANTIEDRWNELKKGEFAELYGRDVQGAIQDRFKNQADFEQKYNALEPMLKVLRDRAGVQSNEDLSKQILDDDSLYEDEASEKGMTVESLKIYKQMEAENQRLKRQEQENIEQQMVRNHYNKLVQQADEFKKTFPDFDLHKALREDSRFLRLTSPEVGLSVKDAYFAIHHDELAPQMMAYGMERAKQQMGQTLQAQRRRPAEGAMKAQGQPAADVKIDPRQLSRSERKRLYEMVHQGKQVTFD